MKQLPLFVAIILTIAMIFTDIIILSMLGLGNSDMVLKISFIVFSIFVYAAAYFSFQFSKLKGKIERDARK